MNEVLGVYYCQKKEAIVGFAVMQEVETLSVSVVVDGSAESIAARVSWCPT